MKFSRTYSAAVILGSICAAAVTPQLASAGDIRDINSYVLFAFDAISVKGQHVIDGGNLLGGNVGSNESLDPNQIEGTFGDPIFMSPGTALVAPAVRLDSRSEIWDLYTNSVNPAFDITRIQNSGPTPIAFPVVNPTTIPPFPTFTPGTELVKLEVGEKRVLDPKNYGELDLRDGSELTLKNGTYNFSKISAGKKVTINVQPDTEVLINTRFTMNEQTRIKGAETARFYIRALGLAEGTFAVGFSKRTEIHGQFYTRDGLINLGENTDLFGRYWGRYFNSDYNFNITYRAPEQVRGRFFDDSDCSSTQNGNEGGLAGIDVYLDCNSNNKFDIGERTTKTDANGAFFFDKVSVGTCSVRPIPPAGKQCSFPSPNCAYSITIGTEGALHDGNIFGLSTPSNPICTEIFSSDSLSGSVLSTPICGENVTPTPYAGAQIYLDCNNNGALDGSEATAITDAAGKWNISKAPIGACAIRTSGVTGLKCVVPGGTCSYNVVLGNTGSHYSGYNFVLAPTEEKTCGEDAGECKVETHIQSSMGIDARGYRLFRLSNHTLSFSKKLAKKEHRRFNKANGKRFINRAHDNYLTLWSLAFNAFPSTTFQCTGTATVACEQKFTAQTRATILSYADKLVGDIKNTLGKKGRKTAAGKKIVSDAEKQRREIFEITQTFPTTYFICDK